MKSNIIFTKEIVMKDNQPIEIILYAPIIGVLYVAASQLANTKEIDQNISKIINGNPLLVKETIIA